MFQVCQTIVAPDIFLFNPDHCRCVLYVLGQDHLLSQSCRKCINKYQNSFLNYIQLRTSNIVLFRRTVVENFSWLFHDEDCQNARGRRPDGAFSKGVLLAYFK